MTYSIVFQPEATTKSLLAIFNTLSPAPVKSFKSKAIAIEKTTEILNVLFEVETPPVVSRRLTSEQTALITVDYAEVKPKSKSKSAPKSAPKNEFTKSKFTVINTHIKSNKRTTLYAALNFILSNDTLTVAEIYQKYNRDNLSDELICDPTNSKLRPADRPGWINNATFRIAVERGHIEMVAA
jgi:hypothetical protein